MVEGKIKKSVAPGMARRLTRRATSAAIARRTTSRCNLDPERHPLRRLAASRVAFALALLRLGRRRCGGRRRGGLLLLRLLLLLLLLLLRRGQSGQVGRRMARG